MAVERVRLLLAERAQIERYAPTCMCSRKMCRSSLTQSALPVAGRDLTPERGMPTRESGNVTELLERWRTGDADAFDTLLPMVYGEMKRIARSARRGERPGHTLQTTALVHETFLRLVNQQRARIDDRNHFLSLAARAMRRILVDHERRRRAAKRRGDAEPTPPFDTAPAIPFDLTPDLLDLHEALDRLAALDERQARLVELRYFGGLSIAEASHVLGISHATLERDWTVARLWLRRQLSMSNDR